MNYFYLVGQTAEREVFEETGVATGRETAWVHTVHTVGIKPAFPFLTAPFFK